MTACRDPSAREVVLVIIGAVLIALAMRWPLPLHLGGDVSKDLGDPLGQAWQVAWIGHALRTQPLDLFQANIYWPLDNTLAFTDALIGYAPAGLVGSGPEAALVRYNLLFLFAYALAFVGAYLLARELGVGPAGAAVAGAAFSYAPWRLGQDAALNILSSGGIPVSLFLLLRGYRRHLPWTILAGWLGACWQLLLGIGLGIQLAYLLLVLGVIAVVYWHRRRPSLPREVIMATAGGIAALLLVTGFLARPYLQVRDDYPEAKRTLLDVEAFSPDLGAFVRAPAGNLVWKGEENRSQAGLPEREHALFPGAVILALALVGVLAPVYPRRRRIALAVAIFGLVALSLGYDPQRSAPLQPFKWVHDYLPGWNAIRVPSRINTLTSLGLALLAAAGAHQIVGSLKRWAASGRLRSGPMATGVAAVLVTAIAVEGSGFQIRDGGVQGPTHPTVPPAPSDLRGAPEPQLHLPYARLYSFGDANLYVLWSTDGFPELANGWGGFVPRTDVEFARDSVGFPDAASVARLRLRGVRTVILHTALAPGTEWAHSARQPVRGLPVTREVRGDDIIYHLKPT